MEECCSLVLECYRLTPGGLVVRQIVQFLDDFAHVLFIGSASRGCWRDDRGRSFGLLDLRKVESHESAGYDRENEHDDEFVFESVHIE